MLVNGEYVENTVPADTCIWPVSVDGEGYMAFRLEDGSNGRITYEQGEYYYATIDGLSEDEYFDNIEYWE